MLIHDMPRSEVDDMLHRLSIGYLAVSVNDKPYIVPLRFKYENGYLYSLTSEGKKMDMMKTNRNVCVSFSDIHGTNNWRSLVISGQFEEIPKSLDKDSLYYHAHDLLATNANWWEPAYVKTILSGEERALEPLYFRIADLEMTGHQAQP